MIPHEREMVKRLAKQPFTLLGINSDDSREVLAKAGRVRARFDRMMV